MDYNQAYNLCCQYHGKHVRIHDNQGNVHHGTITRVDNRNVWLMPDNNYGGYGIGYWGYGRGYGRGYGYGLRYGFGRGFGYGIALGAITGIALTTAFFW